MRRESSYEKAFEKLIEKWFKYFDIPFKYVKTITPGRKGWPDRLLLFGPAAHHIYIEWKRPGEEPKAMQVHIHAELRALGAEVRVYDNHILAMDEITESIKATIGAGPWDEADCPEWWHSIVLKARKGEDCHGPKGV